MGLRIGVRRLDRTSIVLFAAIAVLAGVRLVGAHDLADERLLMMIATLSLAVVGLAESFWLCRGRTGHDGSLGRGVVRQGTMPALCPTELSVTGIDDLQVKRGVDAEPHDSRTPSLGPSPTDHRS